MARIIYPTRNQIDIGDYMFYIDNDGASNPGRVVGVHRTMVTLDYGDGNHQRVAIKNCMFQEPKEILGKYPT